MSDLSLVDKNRTTDLEHLSPEYRERLARMWQDPRVKGRYYVLSGARSYLRQVALYAAFISGVGNPANRPGTSKHEFGLVDREWAEAADIHPTQGMGGSFAELHVIGAENGFYFPYANRATNPEDWHAELAPGRVPLSNKSEEDEMADEYTDACLAPSGRGAWRLKRDGAVETTNFDPVHPVPHFGSLHNLPSERDKPGRYAIAIEPVPHFEPQTGERTYDDLLGYFVVTNDGGVFKFDKDTKNAKGWVN